MDLKDFFLESLADPAQKVLFQEEEAKRKRKQEETRIALERIKARVSNTLDEYNSKNADNTPELLSKLNPNVIDFDSISNPVQLYHMLGDAHVRAKYEKRLMIVLVGFEEKCQIKEQVLLSLDDFFQETKSGATEKMMRELESIETINLDESTVSFRNAIESTTQATIKLTAIAKEISQILALASAYPDNKKGKKKLEKALLKAHDDMKHMSENFNTMTIELQKCKEEYNEAKRMLDAKNAECRKLQKTADQVKKLESTNANLMTEINAVTATLKKTQEEFHNMQVPPPPPAPIVIAADVTELKQELETYRKACENLKLENQQCQEELQKEIENLKTQHEKELTEAQMEHDKEIESLKETIESIQMASKEEQLTQEEELEEEEEEEKEDEFVLQLDIKDDKDAEETDTSSRTETTLELQTPLTGMSDGEAIAITALQKEYIEKENALKAEMQTLRAKSKNIIATLKSDLKESKEKLKSLKKEKDAELKHTVENLEGQKNEIQNELQQIEKKNKELLETTTKQNTKITELETQITDLQSEIINSQSQINDLQGTINTLQQSLLQSETVTRSAQWSEPKGGESNSTLKSTNTPRERRSPTIPMEEVIFSPPSIRNSPVLLSRHSPVLNSPKLNKSQYINKEQALIINRDHPITINWFKVYKSIMKFKEKLISMIKKSPHGITELAINETFQDLMTTGQNEFNFDDHKDVQGQFTQMRFTMTLTLHQLQTILYEYLKTTYSTFEKLKREEKQESSKKEMTQLKQDITKLKEQNRLSEEHYKTQLNENQDKIDDLSRQIDTLKSEMCRLQETLNNTNATIGSVFFTRLDAERNERTLQEAKTNRQISEEDYQSITCNMDEYMSIPGQQFKGIAHQLSEENKVKKAITKVVQTFSSPEHISRVITMILQLQAKRQKVFHDEINQLSTKRLQVAKTLQARLSKTEKQTGLFLVKPIYPTRAHSSFMVPLHRVPPTFTQSLTLQKNTKTTHSSGDNIHPSLRLIRNIRATYQMNSYGSLDDCLDSPHSHRDTRVPLYTTKEWPVSRSRAQSATVSSLGSSPVVPKIVELETCRLREPFSLLKVTRKITTQKNIKNNNNENNKGSLINEQSIVNLPPIHIPPVGSSKTL